MRQGEMLDEQARFRLNSFNRRPAARGQLLGRHPEMQPI